MRGVIPPSAEFGFPTLGMTGEKLVALTASLQTPQVPYLWGAKARPLSVQAPEIRGLDCSGFVQWAIFHATEHSVLLPEGSVEQHGWFIRGGFKRSSVDACSLNDGVVRVAFLAPRGEEPGHVMLVLDGATCECYGGHGVGRRTWLSERFMQSCDVFVVTAPSG